jgi:protein-S-isoprenylcysteine O-methyltransferase Ste14
MRHVHWILFVLAGAGVAVLVTRPTELAWPWTRTIGTCILSLAFAWIGVARFQLGHSFSLTPQARQLVTTGLYARIRNPIYVASPFVLIGLSLVLGQWWPMLLLVAVVPLQIGRARREAAVLRAAFGAEYDRYRSKTWF